MKRGVFTVGLLIGAGAVAGGAAAYGAGIALVWLSAVVWINLLNPWLYVVIGLGFAMCLLSRGKNESAVGRRGAPDQQPVPARDRSGADNQGSSE